MKLQDTKMTNWFARREDARHENVTHEKAGLTMMDLQMTNNWKMHKEIWDMKLPDHVSRWEKTNRCTEFSCTASCRLSHSVEAHTKLLQIDTASKDIDNEQAIAAAPAASAAASQSASTGVDNSCEVYLLVPSAGITLVPCRHARFCAVCSDAVVVILLCWLRTDTVNGCLLC